MVENAKVHCSWCLYNVFVPISHLIVKCYNCGNLKCVDDGIDIEHTFSDSDSRSEWDVDY